jgi:hypothetical protein
MFTVYTKFRTVTAGRKIWTERGVTWRGMRNVENFGGKNRNKGIYLKTWAQTGDVILESLLK